MKKKLITLLTVGVILASSATAAFAEDINTSELKDTIKPAQEQLKQSIGILKTKDGAIKAALEAKAGYKKINKEDLTSAKKNLKDIRAQVKDLKAQLIQAQKSGNTDKILTLHTQLSDNADQVDKIVATLNSYKEQLKNNKAAKAEVKTIKESINSTLEQRKAINEQDKTIKDNISSIKSQLKTAVEANDSQQVQTLTNSLLNNINTLNNNIQQIIGLDDSAVQAVNSWTPQPVSQPNVQSDVPSINN